MKPTGHSGDAKAKHHHSRWRSHFDALTGLPDHTLLQDRITQTIGMMQRASESMVLMLVDIDIDIDIDSLQSVTDTLSPQTGDDLLLEVVQRLRGSVRLQDTVARVGKTEFALMLPCTAAAGAAHLAAQLLEELTIPRGSNVDKLTLTAFMGIASYPHDGEDFDTLFKAVETALRGARKLGRNGFEFYRDNNSAQDLARSAEPTAIRHVATLHEGIGRDRDALSLAILNSVSAEIAVLDRDGVIVEVNEQWRRFAKVNAVDCGTAATSTSVGINYLAICQASNGLHAEGAVDARLGIQAVMEGRLPSFEMEYPCHSPEQQRWFSMSVTPLGSGNSGVVVAHADISARKLAELELQSVLAALDQHAIVVTTDLRGCITFMNDKFCAISGYAHSELLNQSHRMLNSGLHPNAFFQAQYATITSGQVWHGAICNRSKDGSLYWVQTTISPFLGADGRPEKYVSISTDITDYKQSEESLRQHAMQLKALSQRVLEVQETERRHVAIELHDELGQLLTAIKINLQSSERFKDWAAGEHNAENIRIVEDALQQVRRLALALRPSMLDDLGLAPALRWMAEQSATRNGFTTQFHIARLPDRLAPDIEVACFRIVQEALTNIARYAQAKRVTIHLRQEGNTMVLCVHDDGQGFDVAAMRSGALAGGSMGVLGMQERAGLIGGQFDIQSTPAPAPGNGTTVSVHFPLHLRGGSA